MWILKVSLSDKEVIALQGRMTELFPRTLKAIENTATPLNLSIIYEYQALTKILKGNGKHEVEK